MCPPTVINTCGCSDTKAGGRSFVGELVGELVGFLARQLRAAAWWTLRTTAVLLVALAVITAKAGWRGLRALYRAARRRHEARRRVAAILLEERPTPLAITAVPDGHLLWSQINKESVR